MCSYVSDGLDLENRFLNYNEMVSMGDLDEIYLLFHLEEERIALLLHIQLIINVHDSKQSGDLYTFKIFKL